MAGKRGEGKRPSSPLLYPQLPYKHLPTCPSLPQQVELAGKAETEEEEEEAEGDGGEVVGGGGGIQCSVSPRFLSFPLRVLSCRRPLFFFFPATQPLAF